MWQPVQYYHTKLQLTQMDLETRLQIANTKRKMKKAKIQQTEGKELKSEEQKIYTQQVQEGLQTEILGETVNQQNDFVKESAKVQMANTEQLQSHIIWAEILGEPVSVKRRKKRVEQLYGNQCHAYRR